MSLTPMQQQLLQILDTVSPDALTGQEILDLTQSPLIPGSWDTPQGVHQTASTLSRKGLIMKINPTAIPPRSISYAITIAGKTTLNKQKAANHDRIIRSRTTG